MVLTLRTPVTGRPSRLRFLRAAANALAWCERDALISHVREGKTLSFCFLLHHRNINLLCAQTGWHQHS